VALTCNSLTGQSADCQLALTRSIRIIERLTSGDVAYARLRMSKLHFSARTQVGCPLHDEISSNSNLSRAHNSYLSRERATAQENKTKWDDQWEAAVHCFSFPPSSTVPVSLLDPAVPCQIMLGSKATYVLF